MLASILLASLYSEIIIGFSLNFEDLIEGWLITELSSKYALYFKVSNFY